MIYLHFPVNLITTSFYITYFSVEILTFTDLKSIRQQKIKVVLFKFNFAPSLACIYHFFSRDPTEFTGRN